MGEEARAVAQRKEGSRGGVDERRRGDATVRRTGIGIREEDQKGIETSGGLGD